MSDKFGKGREGNSKVSVQGVEKDLAGRASDGLSNGTFEEMLKGSSKSLPVNEQANSTKDSQRPQYQWPPQRDPDLSYRANSRNPVHSILTALPVIMLVAGLYFYFQREAQQTNSAPIREASVELSGTFSGLSHTSDRHYLWLDVNGIAKGVRIKSDQVVALEPLERGARLNIKMAPSVEESRIFWVWHVEQAGVVYIDAADLLR